MRERLVYSFGGGEAEGGRELKELLGGKGANLCEMTRLGVPVPPGFVITTDVCRTYMRDRRYPDELRDLVRSSLGQVERLTGKEFGSASDPLLVSVRSGAAVSMPGMMDTILNLGMNDETVRGLAEQADDRRFAFDAYRRFVQMYGNVVLGVSHDEFETRLEAQKSEEGVREDTQISADGLEALVDAFKAHIAEVTGTPFPEDPEDQLWGAIDAVFDSWGNSRARAYRRVNGIPEDLGTAVNVMAMVFGNMGETSGTGVAFTRDPSTGEKALYGEFLVNAQGEDVVAGIRDPLPIEQMADRLPESFSALREAADTLERHYRDVQDLEFTVERGTLYMLQTRTAKRSAAAAVRSAVEMEAERLIGREEAILRVDPNLLDQLLHPRLDPNAEVEVLTTGLPASPGAAAGRVVFNPDEADERGAAGEEVILVRKETSPEDFHGMVAARGIVTARGGMTSHAAVVARGMGKCCVAGAGELRIDEAYGRFSVGEHTIAAGDWITLDGSTGRVILGRVPTVDPEISEEFRTLLGWADETRRLNIRANADTPRDAEIGRGFGAEGIGLCRTEHMFFEDGRIDAVREMILTENAEDRQAAIDRLLPMQRDDFVGIFRVMDGLPVTIRLLDPPLHEFLPYGAAEIKSMARKTGMSATKLREMVERHRETNPMLGHRGVRLAMTMPELPKMQTRAIFEAAIKVQRDGVKVRPEIMIPLIATEAELAEQKRIVDQVAREVFEETGETVPYLVGTMIELPRAALIAGRIAGAAEFFSFGTNDLTQTAFGMSRDDAASFMPTYLERGILRRDPFQVLDTAGVGRLVEIATREGRAEQHDLKVGICGEHGGDPDSVDFFHRTGLDYVSCSPFRVPVARLAAAQAVLRERARNGEQEDRADAAPVAPADTAAV